MDQVNQDTYSDSGGGIQNPVLWSGWVSSCPSLPGNTRLYRLLGPRHLDRDFLFAHYRNFLYIFFPLPATQLYEHPTHPSSRTCSTLLFRGLLCLVLLTLNLIRLCPLPHSLPSPTPCRSVVMFCILLFFCLVVLFCFFLSYWGLYPQGFTCVRQAVSVSLSYTYACMLFFPTF